MRTFLSIFQILLSIVLMAVVMLQPRKQGRGDIFGGATLADPTANQWSRFTGLSKITVVICALFMVNSLVLLILYEKEAISDDDRKHRNAQGCRVGRSFA